MIELVGEARTATGYSTKLSTQTGETCLVYWLDYLSLGLKVTVTRNGKPKIGLKHCNKADIKLRLLKDDVASAHIIFFFFFLSFWSGFSFCGYRQSETEPLWARVLAVVFSHSILSGILALEANTLI